MIGIGDVDGDECVNIVLSEGIGVGVSASDGVVITQPLDVWSVATGGGYAVLIVEGGEINGESGALDGLPTDADVVSRGIVGVRNEKCV